MDRALNTTKVKTSDRVIVLAPIEGMKPKTNSGVVDGSLLTGTNKLHAVMDTQNCMWSLKYESGTLPQPLQQKFTSYSKMMGFLKEYYKRRNIEIKEVID